MHPENQSDWEQGPAPEWDREAVWERITELRGRRHSPGYRRWSVAASLLVLVVAGGVGVSALLAPSPVPDEVLPMMKDRELDTELVPDADSVRVTTGLPVLQPDSN